MTHLSELIERVEAATGPDRELDIALLALWEPGHDALKPYDDRYQTELRDGVFSVWKLDGGYSASIPFPRFTASIDAALALVERVRAGSWRLMLMKALHEVNKAPDIHDISQMPRFIVLHLLLSLSQDQK